MSRLANTLGPTASRRIRRRRQNVLKAPSLFEAVTDDRRCGSDSFSPLRLRKRFPAKCQKLNDSCVLILLNRSRPTAIALAVIAAIVNSFNGMVAGRLFAHIAQKVEKIGSPFIAHGNAATAIVGVSRMILSMASCHHVDPRNVFRAFRQAVNRVIFFGMLRSILSLKASAAFGVAPPKLDSFDDPLLAAHAYAIPNWNFAAIATSERFNSQSGKGLSNKITHGRLTISGRSNYTKQFIKDKRGALSQT